MEIRGYSASAAAEAGVINEDSILIDEQRGLFVVADGMGGTASGNIASQAAVQLIATHLDGQKAAIEAFERGEKSRVEILRLLE